MSCNNQETGDIQFTKTGYTKIIGAYRKAYNEYINNVFDIAMTIHSQLHSIKGGSATKRRKEKANELLSSHDATHYSFSSMCHTALKFHIQSELIYLIKAELFRGKNGTLTKPRRSAFPKLTNKDRTFDLHDGELSVSFKDAYTDTYGWKVCGGKQKPLTRDVMPTIEWRVDENNRAVERAHNTPIAKLLFDKVLKHYTWKRNEGGAFYYTDEYDREGAHHAGGQYESSPSKHFGPLGEKAQEERRKRIFRMAKRSLRK